MHKLIWVALFLIIASVCYAGRVYVEDKGVVIPIDTQDGDIKAINNGNGTQTWIFDKPGQTDIVHPDGTTTSTYDYDNDE